MNTGSQWNLNDPQEPKGGADSFNHGQGPASPPDTHSPRTPSSNLSARPRPPLPCPDLRTPQATLPVPSSQPRVGRSNLQNPEAPAGGDAGRALSGHVFSRRPFCPAATLGLLPVLTRHSARLLSASPRPC